MEKAKIQLSQDLFIETYPFSDYITCVEIFYQGQSYSTLCSDNSLVQEWTEHPELLLELCSQRLAIKPKSRPTSSQMRQELEKGLEVEYYPFSDDVFCINVYKEGSFSTSFCTDKGSFSEWQEEPEAMLSIVKKMI